MYSIILDGEGLRGLAPLSNVPNRWPLRETRSAAAYKRARHDDAHNFGPSPSSCRHFSANDTFIIRCAATATAELVASYCCTYMSLNDSPPRACLCNFRHFGLLVHRNINVPGSGCVCREPLTVPHRPSARRGCLASRPRARGTLYAAIGRGLEQGFSCAYAGTDWGPEQRRGGAHDMSGIMTECADEFVAAPTTRGRREGDSRELRQK